MELVKGTLTAIVVGLIISILIIARLVPDGSKLIFFLGVVIGSFLSLSMVSLSKLDEE